HHKRHHRHGRRAKSVCTLRRQLALETSAHLTVNISTLLFPPLVQPKSPVFPLGVSTITFTCPGPLMTSLVSFTVISRGLTMVAPRAVELISTSDDETKLLPLMVSISPCCNCENVTVLGENEPISGAGRELPHKGFSVLLQPRTERASASRQASDRPQLRRRMGDTPLRMVLPVRLLEQK